MPEKKASFLRSGSARDYVDNLEGQYKTVPRMRAATWQDKTRDWMNSLQDNPAIQH